MRKLVTRALFCLATVFLLLPSSSYSIEDDIHTVLSIESDTYDGDISFKDSSQYSHDIYPNGNVINSTAQVKTGSSSIYFDGAGDSLCCA